MFSAVIKMPGASSLSFARRSNERCDLFGYFKKLPVAQLLATPAQASFSWMTPKSFARI